MFAGIIKEGLTQNEESPDKELQHSAKKPRKEVPARNWLLRGKKNKKKTLPLTLQHIHTSQVLFKKKVWKEIGADYIVTATETESEGGLIFVAASSSHDSNGMALK